MVEKFELTNARGISVGINNFKLMSYTPTGLGVKFNNNYNNYQTYFKLTKQSLSQGQFNAKILFGSVVSETFDSFQKFSEFLAYQPYTMTYTSDSEMWKREAMLSEMTKSEIGSSSNDPNLLDESFTLEFINNWYNNKTAEYKSYDPDPNLGTYGKIYRPKYDPTVNRNLLLGTKDFSGDSNLSITGEWGNLSLWWGRDEEKYKGFTVLKREAVWGSLGQYYDAKPNTTYTFSFYAKASEASNILEIFTLPNEDWNSQVVSPPVFANRAITTEWQRYSITFTTKSGGTIFPSVCLKKDGATIYVAGYKLEEGTIPIDWTPAPEDKLAIPFEYAYVPYYVYQESSRPSNEKVMSLNNKSQYFGLQSGSPSVITVKGPCSVNPTWTVVQKGNVVATDGFVLKLTDNQKLVVSSYPEDQYARLYNPDGSYVDVSQLQDYTKTNFVQIPEGESTVLFYLDADSDVNITFKEERLLV